METLRALHQRAMDIQSDQAHQKMVCLMSQISLKDLEIGRLKGDGVDTHTHTSDVADTHTHRLLEIACLGANMPGTDTDMAERDRDV